MFANKQPECGKWDDCNKLDEDLRRFLILLEFHFDVI